MVHWKRVLVITFNVIIGVYLILAATVLNKPAEASQVCTGVKVNIERGVIDGFLTPDEVRRILTTNGQNPTGHTMESVNLRTMEERLQAQELIDHAECYKTQEGTVNIRVTERVPVVRVMAQNGDDYYVDKDGQIMQNTGYSCNLVVATGSISRPYACQHLASVGRTLIEDDFWRDQIVQLNVLPDSTLEMVPRVGGHIIYIGKPVDIDRKLDRLRKFYAYGLTQAGWNKYSRISVEYANQIVCKKRKP